MRRTGFGTISLGAVILLAAATASQFLPQLRDGWQVLFAPEPLAMPAPFLAKADGVALRALTEGLPEGAKALDWRAEGRVVAAGAGGLLHEWPGLVLWLRFAGDGLILGFDDDENRFRLVVDGRAVADFTRPGSRLIGVSGLGAGVHEAQLQRLTEAAAPRRVTGIFVPVGGEGMAPPAPPARRIDFFGDSDSVGYGIAHDGRQCPGDDVFLTSDVTEAFPMRVARRLGTGAEIVARSGIGMLRNYAGARPDETLTQLRDRQLPSDPKTASPRHGGAWLTVVAAGSNDFATPLAKGEPWADMAALSAAFSAAYTTFLQDVLAENPGRPIIVMDVPATDADPHAELTAVVAALAQQGAPVSLVRIGALDRGACDWHPSGADHAQMAQALLDEIARLQAEGKLEAL